MPIVDLRDTLSAVTTIENADSLLGILDSIASHESSATNCTVLHDARRIVRMTLDSLTMTILSQRYDKEATLAEWRLWKELCDSTDSYIDAQSCADDPDDPWRYANGISDKLYAMHTQLYRSGTDGTPMDIKAIDSYCTEQLPQVKPIQNLYAKWRNTYLSMIKSK